MTESRPPVVPSAPPEEPLKPVPELTLAPLSANVGQKLKEKEWHPYYSVLMSPFLILIGAPLGVSRHHNKKLWLAVYYSLFLAAAVLIGVSYAPRVQPNPESCCHPSQGTLSQREAENLFGPCHDLTPLGKSHPDVKSSHCSRRTYTEALLLAVGLACLAVAFVVCIVAGWVRVYGLVKHEETILLDPSQNPEFRSDMARLAVESATRWHHYDIYMFALFMVAYTLYGFELDFYQNLVALLFVFVWWILLSPSAHILHQLYEHKRVAEVLAFTFILCHDVFIPIARFWHCCEHGLAWKCQDRRTSCSGGFKHLNDWPIILWVAYGISMAVALLLVALAWVRLKYAHRVWYAGLLLGKEA